MKKIIMAVLSLLVIALFIIGCARVEAPLEKKVEPKKVVEEETPQDAIDLLEEGDDDLDALDEELDFTELEQMMDEELDFEI